jgi:hypothetical protein
MKEIIKNHIDNPEKLEQLYNEDRKAFERGFYEIYQEAEKTQLLEYWKIRLNYTKVPAKEERFDRKDIVVLLVSCLLTGFLIKIPAIFGVSMADEEIFYARNAGIIVFFGLCLYTAWTNRIFELKKLSPILAAFLLLTVYVNLLPPVNSSDAVNLVYLHLPLLLWSIFAIIFLNFDLRDKPGRINFLRHNGDLAILMALIAIAGGILTGITIGLFEAIGIKIENIYFNYVVVVGAVSVPIVATFIINNFASLTNKIAPVIARIFSPLVLITAIVFLVALAVTGKDPYNDRDFLLIFNVMLIGVMAVVTFSIPETSANEKQRFNEITLFVLSIVTVIIDLIALSAIFYRLGTYGITPNRLAVLGSNILILGNLILLVRDLYKVNFKNSALSEVELTIARYLPVYEAWIIIVIFAFPVIFGVK